LTDKRGKSKNCHLHKIDDQIWEHFNVFIKTIPTTPTHYTESNKFYFDNPSVTKTTLYTEFCNYYNRVVNNNLTLCYNTFINYFKNNYNYGFSHPRKDVCDVCFECEQTGINNLTIDKKLEYENHLSKKDNFQILKTNICKRLDILILEIDYCQNKPLPKLPVSALFYSRLLWLMIFNVHIHNFEKSFMYYFLEGEYKRGANSVCSFVYSVLKNITINAKKIVIFSDSADGQNRNYIVLRFLLCISVKFNVKIK
jgi:hypothetical protein